MTIWRLSVHISIVTTRKNGNTKKPAECSREIIVELATRIFNLIILEVFNYLPREKTVVLFFKLRMEQLHSGNPNFFWHHCFYFGFFFLFVCVCVGGGGGFFFFFFFSFSVLFSSSFRKIKNKFLIREICHFIILSITFSSNRSTAEIRSIQVQKTTFNFFANSAATSDGISTSSTLS